MLLAVVFGVILIAVARFQPQRIQDRIGAIIGWTICATILIWTIIHVSLGRFDSKTDYPIVLCNFCGVIIPALMVTKKRIYLEVMYFWVMSATLQAIITPELANNLPNYSTIKYWIVHCGLVLAVLYAAIVYKIMLDWKSVFKSILWIHAYVLFASICNYFLNANYFFLREKPKQATPLDLLPDWPWYIVIGEPITIFVFFVLLIPFLIAAKRFGNKEATSDSEMAFESSST